MDLQFGIFQILRCPIESNGSVRKLYWSSGQVVPRESEFRLARTDSTLSGDLGLGTTSPPQRPNTSCPNTATGSL
jgi:hypothetical protein